MPMTPEERLRRRNEFDGALVYGTAAFNRSTGRDRQFAAHDAAVSEYINPAMGALRPELVRERPCPVCEGREAETAFVKQGFPYRRCLSCGMLYVSPVLRPEAQADYYRNEDPWNQVLLTGPQQEMDQRKFHYVLDLIEEHLPAKGGILDIGCGPGVFLEVARRRGWTVGGIEFNERCVARLRSLGIPVVDRPLEEAGLPPASYQCATLWDVLEHITEPGDFLTQIQRLLAPGGVLGIAVPNADGLVNRILHAKARTFGGDAHVNLFGPRTLPRLLESRGFRVVERESFLTELGTINNHLNYQDPYFGEGAAVLDLLTPQLLHERLLGSRLLVLARAEAP